METVTLTGIASDGVTLSLDAGYTPSPDSLTLGPELFNPANMTTTGHCHITDGILSVHEQYDANGNGTDSTIALEEGAWYRLVAPIDELSGETVGVAFNLNGATTGYRHTAGEQTDYLRAPAAGGLVIAMQGDEIEAAAVDLAGVSVRKLG